MTKDEILAAYPLVDLFNDLEAFVNANPVEDNVTETKASMIGLITAAKDMALIPNTPKYNVFLSVYEYVRIRIDGNICQNYPKLCGFYKARFNVMTVFDFGVFD